MERFGARWDGGNMWLKAVDDSMSGSRTGEDAAETADGGSESGLGRILDDS